MIVAIGDAFQASPNKKRAPGSYLGPFEIDDEIDYLKVTRALRRKTRGDSVSKIVPWLLS